MTTALALRRSFSRGVSAVVLALSCVAGAPLALAQGGARQPLVDAAADPAAPRVWAEENLPRRGWVGVGLGAGEGQSVAVQSVVAGGTAQAAGLRAGDVVVSLDGRAVRTPDDVSQASRGARPGAEAVFVVRRAGQETTLRAPWVTLGSEAIEGGTIEYRTLRAGRGGAEMLLRAIVTTPAQAAPEAGYPVFVFMQGLACATLDRPSSATAFDTLLAHEMTRAGFVTLRIDKPGLGDSRGPACGDIDFQTELECFRAAGIGALQLEGVDASRVYYFGHSMGGVMAPYVAAELRPRGVIVFGTLLRTWMEYQLENTRRQMELFGAPADAVNDELRRVAGFEARLLLDRMTPGEIAEKHPELVGEGGVQDPQRIFGRHVRFFQQLQELNLARAWTAADTSVLAIHAEFDWVSSPLDHRMIADVARGAGHVGSFVSLPGLDHAFTRHDSVEDSMTRGLGQGSWDGAVTRAVLAFVEEAERARGE